MTRLLRNVSGKVIHPVKNSKERITYSPIYKAIL